MKRIGIIVGSARKESYCRKIGFIVHKMLEKEFEIQEIEIDHLAIYNEDKEKEERSWHEFRDNLKSFNGFIFITPEYNRSMPALLKNALDIGSRPMNDNGWNRKPTAIISVTQGSLGAIGASKHLHQVLSFFDMYIMNQPELYISKVADLFYENGEMTCSDTKKFLEKFSNQFIKWVEKTK